MESIKWTEYTSMLKPDKVKKFILMAQNIKIMIFYNVTSYSLVISNYTVSHPVRPQS